MKIIHSIFSCVIALLVSMPMCVCGHSFLSTSIEESSCCHHQHEEKNENHSEENERNCDLCHHDHLQYLSASSEIPLPEVPEHDISGDFLFAESLSHVPHLSKENQLRAPPPSGIFPASRNIIYCIYRL